MKATTEMQLVPITKLVPYVNNARTHSPEQIKKLRSSLREFGFINPVIIDRDYGVIAGHGRILAAKEEGMYRSIITASSATPRMLTEIWSLIQIRQRSSGAFTENIWKAPAWIKLLPAWKRTAS